MRFFPQILRSMVLFFGRPRSNGHLHFPLATREHCICQLQQLQMQLVPPVPTQPPQPPQPPEPPEPPEFGLQAGLASSRQGK